MSYVRVTIFIVSLRLTENAIQLSNNNTKSSTQQAHEVSAFSHCFTIRCIFAYHLHYCKKNNACPMYTHYSLKSCTLSAEIAIEVFESLCNCDLL